MSTKYTPSHIANYFLIRSKKDKIKVTPMKLIKLVYFAYAWYLALFKEKLFDEKIEKWQYEPVISSLYHEFKRFKKANITELSLDNESFEPVLIADDDDNSHGVLSAIWLMYKDDNADTLSKMTHRDGSAWSKAENVLDDEYIIKSARDGIAKYIEQFGLEQ